MVIFTSLSVLIFIFLTILSLMIMYLWFHALAYLVTKNNNLITSVEPFCHFVFIVPAHNEEIGIVATINSLLNVKYPKALFDIVVIADNCTDSTAEKAKSAGALCMVRTDAAKRGKGYALNYAFSELLEKGYDAFIVIDADSIVSENFLSVLNERLEKGEKVIQAYYGLSNPDASILTYLFQVGNLIENKLFWVPKQFFGLPVILRGNGMCFTRDVLLTNPWSAFSIVEDTEYGLMLIKNGIRVHFVAEIGVFATQPVTLMQAFAQRVRWATGNAAITKLRALSLLKEGLFLKRNDLFDLGISLIVGSRPLLLVCNIFLICFSYIIQADMLIFWSTLLLFFQVLYIVYGVLLNGITTKHMIFLIASPFYLFWLCMVSLLGFAGFRKNQWIRTTR